MRFPRRKIKGRKCYYHLYNQICGLKGEYPFSEEDKLFAINLLKKLSQYYLIEIMEMCIMGNHFHVIVHVPGRPLSSSNALERHNNYHNISVQTEVSSPMTERLGRKVSADQIDISHFMQVFQQRFTIYYNKAHNRRGSLWGDRFKSTILEDSIALWCCVEYVIMNPLRANLCKSPDDYQFSSWGERKFSGKHPYHDNLLKHLTGTIIYSTMTKRKSIMNRVYELLEKSIYDTIAWERGEKPNSSDQGISLYGMKRKYHRILIKVRKWTYGCVVGSHDFVQNIAEEFNENNRVQILKTMSTSSKNDDAIFSYYQDRIFAFNPT
ncbi:transposase [bacterium]|nr:transposase [bacterium]